MTRELATSHVKRQSCFQFSGRLPSPIVRGLLQASSQAAEPPKRGRRPVLVKTEYLLLSLEFCLRPSVPGMRCRPTLYLTLGLILVPALLYS